MLVLVVVSIARSWSSSRHAALVVVGTWLEIAAEGQKREMERRTTRED